MEIANIITNRKKGSIYGLMGNVNPISNNSNIAIITPYRLEITVQEFLNNPKAINSLKLVMLDPNIISKKMAELSEEELKCISLAKSLIEKKDYIVLDYFEKGFTYKEKEAFKRLFKKLSSEYDQTILIFTNDITFLWDICEEIILVDENEIVNVFNKERFFELLEWVDKPEINKITDLIREKNIKIGDYKNVLDLLKSIYRIKEHQNEISN